MGPPPPLLPLHPSHIADNRIGAEGCIALSSSLVHLSHLKELGLGGKCVWIQRVVVVVLLSAAEVAFVALSRACFTRFCLILILVIFFCFLFDWGRHYDRWKVRPVFLESEIREKRRAASARAKTIELDSVYFTYLSHFIS